MDLEKTIEKVKNSCDNYIDPDLVINHINKDYFILNTKSDYVFINCGLVVPIPFLNEFDIFSTKKETIKVSNEEFIEFTPLTERYFGILYINKEEYILGTIDLCHCSVNSTFTPLKNRNNTLYKKLDEIATSLMC